MRGRYVKSEMGSVFGNRKDKSMVQVKMAKKDQKGQKSNDSKFIKIISGHSKDKGKHIFAQEWSFHNF